MLDLKKIYDTLPLPQKTNLNSFSAKTIKGFENHRIAKNANGNPNLLILISESNKDFFVANQNLFSIKVTHNVRCEIETDNEVTYNNFSVISYVGQSDEVEDLFLKTCQILIKSLGQNPSNKKIKQTVDKFIELFKSIKEPSKKSIQGLWCELFLIDQSNHPEQVILGWHSTPEENFDFSFDKLYIEVKSTSKEIRQHYFSSSQLKPIKNVTILISSIITSTNSSGLSVIDLMNKIDHKLDGFTTQREKLHLLVYSTLGTSINVAEGLKFNYKQAIDSIRFYKSENIPKIEHEYIPNEVSEVKFKSDLSQIKPIENKELSKSLNGLFDFL